ncbi:MAG: hypothetical protein AAF086_00455 [Planctomycetota bacterium]
MLTAIGLGSFLGVVVVCGGGVALTMLFFQQQIASFNSIISGNYGTIPNLNYTMQLPPTAVEGQPFEIELTLENTGTSPITLHSLDDYSGLTLIQSDPPWQSLSGGEMMYQLPLPPGQVVTVKVTAQTDMLGSQTINIDAHADGGMSWAEAYGTINVVAASAPPAGSDAAESKSPAVTVTPP